MGELGKKTRTAEQLRAMVQLRIDDLPAVRQRTADRLPAPVAGKPWQSGQSWTLLVPPIANDVDQDVARIVESLRCDYDLG